ncbi:GIY-YIG nuclease family protein [bacterium]|nr:GIY-YIG nuclease family protein [bacterium]
MNPDKFFPPRPESRPTIYAYAGTNQQYRGLLKIGYTAVDVKARVAQQYPIKKPGKPPYRIVPEESAMRKLLGKKQNMFYRDYQVVVAAGSAAGIGVELNRLSGNFCK